MKIRTIAVVICLVAMAASVNVLAQRPQDGPRRVPPREHVGPHEGIMVPPVIMPGTQFDGDRFVFVGSEMSFNGKVVKGAPYSGVAVNESVQVLADGNRIVRKSSSSVYRDSEGRTRREQSLAKIGPYASAGDVPQTVFIHDPVAQVNYILDPNRNIARRVNAKMIDTEVLKKKLHQDAAGAEDRAKIEVHIQAMEAGGGKGVVWAAEGAKARIAPVTESLGKQMIEGVEAEGTRVTFTIPAGEIGNEAPISMVSERWYSADLQATIMTRSSDPRSGEMIYRLTSINRSEPARSLFEVPADYTIKDEDVNMEMKMRIETEVQKLKFDEEVRKKKPLD